ncbi:hypothetical protein BKA83DRAFT_4126480 [Pisolithus microcarpus]|nr:hypothetical protein BKA83DRAFT_4126480 [Pisolithus microcarpus]
MFRFHPYARVKPSARELVMATLYASDEDGPIPDEQDFNPSYGTVVPGSNSSSVVAQGVDGAINVMYSANAPQRKLSMSTLVVSTIPRNEFSTCWRPTCTALYTRRPHSGEGVEIDKSEETSEVRESDLTQLKFVGETQSVAAHVTNEYRSKAWCVLERTAVESCEKETK